MPDLFDLTVKLGSDHPDLQPALSGVLADARTASDAWKGQRTDPFSVSVRPTSKKDIARMIDAAREFRGGKAFLNRYNYNLLYGYLTDVVAHLNDRGLTAEAQRLAKYQAQMWEMLEALGKATAIQDAMSGVEQELLAAKKAVMAPTSSRPPGWGDQATENMNHYLKGIAEGNAHIYDPRTWGPTKTKAQKAGYITTYYNKAREMEVRLTREGVDYVTNTLGVKPKRGTYVP